MDADAVGKKSTSWLNKVAAVGGAVVNAGKQFVSEMTGGSAAPYESELAAKMQGFMAFHESTLQASARHAELYERLRALLADALSGQHVVEDIDQTCVCIQQYAERVSYAHFLLN